VSYHLQKACFPLFQTLQKEIDIHFLQQDMWPVNRHYQLNFQNMNIMVRQGFKPWLSKTTGQNLKELHFFLPCMRDPCHHLHSEIELYIHLHSVLCYHNEWLGPQVLSSIVVTYTRCQLFLPAIITAIK